MLLDLGTGDGRAVLRAARAQPRALAIGLDANADAMRRSARMAARPASKGGTPNALFVVADACAMPTELQQLASEVRIVFPWASLLEGVLGRGDGMLARIASACRPGAEVRAWWSVTDRDAVDDAPADAVRLAWEAAGFTVQAIGLADASAVAATESSWAKRLGVADGRRPAMALVAILRSGATG